MRAWIRKHRIGAFLLAVLALAGIGGILVFVYFTYWFTLGLANAPGVVQPRRHGVTAVYVYSRSPRWHAKADHGLTADPVELTSPAANIL
jgi:hypothetical protein